MSFHFRDPNYELDKKAFDNALNSEQRQRIASQRFFEFSIFLPFLAAHQHFWVAIDGGRVEGCEINDNGAEVE